MPKLKPEIKKLWIDALRSGKYEQGQGRLRTGDNFCCLGVLCDLYKNITTEGRWEEEKPHVGRAFWVGGVSSTDVLPEPVYQWAFAEATPYAQNPAMAPYNYTLAEYNDGEAYEWEADEGNSIPAPYNFTHIANLIEEQL